MRSVLCCSSPGEFVRKTSKLCFRGASAAVCLLLCTALAAFFALVGGSLGAIVGSLIGLQSESRFLHRTAIGTVVGLLLSFELFKISVAFFVPEGSSFSFVFGPLFDSATVRVAQKLVQQWSTYTPTAVAQDATSDLEDVPWRRHVKGLKDSDRRILKTRITRNDLIDSSGNRVCCPICLEDFEFRQVARKLPCCRNLFHQGCIDKWLHRHNSCPLCRCTVVRKKPNRV